MTDIACCPQWESVSEPVLTMARTPVNLDNRGVQYLQTKSRRPAPRLVRGAGLTLIELMMTLVIIVTVASVVLPRLSQKNTQLRTAAQRLVADLEFAQIESIVHPDDPRIVVVDLANARYYIATTGSPATPVTNPSTSKPYETRFGAGEAIGLDNVTISAISFGGDSRLGYGKYGELDQATDATITLAKGGSTVTVTIDPINGAVTAGSIE